jgi:hypothetical protein
MARLSQTTYDAVRDGAITSARAVLPLLAAGLGEPSGLLDVGCGEGHWMREAHRLWSTSTMLGLDLVEDTEHGFPMTSAWDAELGQRMPLRGGPSPTEKDENGMPATALYRWPLVLCLEVAEHVSPEAGDWLVEELCRVAERVVFSAAIPGQGGDGHVNEQWPTYWWERFAQQGWRLHDPYRPHLWRLPDVEPWYAQNLLLAQPIGNGGGIGEPPLHLVHPAVFDAKLAQAAYWREEYLASDRRFGELLSQAGGVSSP